MPGAKIGNGAIVAARSVVTGDVPAHAMAGGNPARLIKMHFDDATIVALEAIAWWDWPVDKITRALRAIVGGDIEAPERYRTSKSAKASASEG